MTKMKKNKPVFCTGNRPEDNSGPHAGKAVSKIEIPRQTDEEIAAFYAEWGAALVAIAGRSGS
jgi:hypothetical protein